ncbi:MAG TPA: flavin reductase family protein [Terriglobales bacterium]|nr:flavin reductase family protein [Terriglobales bacterium]
MDVAKKREALRCFPKGVYVLTSKSGTRYGAATITWVSQASFKPPLLVAAIRTRSNIFTCLSESRVAALHVVACGQESFARKFFTGTKALDRTINGEPFVEKTTSAPILQNARACVECRVRQIVDGGGDHTLVIMEVVDAEFTERFRPLTIADTPWEYGG